jgi:hypothetical protein
MEVIFLITYGFLQYGRLTAGMKGNRIETWRDLLFMIFFTGFSIFANAFFIAL